MNTFLRRTLFYGFLTVLSLQLEACKKDKDADATKTLNKSTLTSNKTWYNQGSSIIHIFKSNGVYTNTGTWKWVNNSDTMEIVTVNGGFKTYWKMNWNTDHEMNCKRIGSGTSDELYKDQGW